MFTVYILKSLRSGRFYVGMTNDLGRRLDQHNKGHCRSTKAFIPWALIFTETGLDRAQARVREKYHKAGFVREKRKF